MLRRVLRCGWVVDRDSRPCPRPLTGSSSQCFALHRSMATVADWRPAVLRALIHRLDLPRAFDSSSCPSMFLFTWMIRIFRIWDRCEKTRCINVWSLGLVPGAASQTSPPPKMTGVTAYSSSSSPGDMSFSAVSTSISWAITGIPMAFPLRIIWRKSMPAGADSSRGSYDAGFRL